MQGSGAGQPYPAAAERRAEAGPRERGRSAPRLLAAGVLAVLGLAAVVAGLGGLTLSAYRGIALVREAGTSAEYQRFAFDRRAWQAIPVDDLFPPTYRTTTAAPMLGVERTFTRIGVAAPADCRSAFDPPLVRLLSAHGCGPVLRAGYTDATQTLVVTVGVAVVGTTPAQQHDLNAATQGSHDDLRPRPLAFPGTAAASFGDQQRVAFRVYASSSAPYVTFAVTGFSDGRPSTADAGVEAANQSGAQVATLDIEDTIGKRLDAALTALHGRSR